MPPTLPVLLGVALLVLVRPPAATGAQERWSAPVSGPVVRPFHTGPDRFARGQHRGVDLAAPSGTPVRAACPGRVAFAGRVPAGGRTVSVRCGRLVATYQHLETIAVRRGQEVPAGLDLGTAGRSGDPRDRRPHVHLGAREHATGRYVDPLTLLAPSHPVVPAVPPPAARTRHRPFGPGPVGPAPRPAPVRPRPAPIGQLPAPVRPPAHDPDPRAETKPAHPSTMPWTAWAGLACLAAGVPLGGLTRRRRRARGACAQPIPRPAS